VTLLLVALGAALGAPARYLVDRAVQFRHETTFPWGTLSVNLAASLCLGVLLGLGGRVGPNTADLVGTGFCGTLSTYSTFGYETLRLYQDRARFHATANLAVSLIGGIGAAALGWSCGVALG
jgi:CrcB protein